VTRLRRSACSNVPWRLSHAFWFAGCIRCAAHALTRHDAKVGGGGGGYAGIFLVSDDPETARLSELFPAGVVSAAGKKVVHVDYPYVAVTSARVRQCQ
jgi:hypothetical protein